MIKLYTGDIYIRSSSSSSWTQINEVIRENKALLTVEKTPIVMNSTARQIQVGSMVKIVLMLLDLSLPFDFNEEVDIKASNNGAEFIAENIILNKAVNVVGLAKMTLTAEYRCQE